MKKILNFLSMFFWLLLRITWIIWGCICIIIAFHNPLNNLINPAKELSYSKTVQLIIENQVESVELFNNKMNAEIYLKNDKTRYKTNIPNEEVFCEFVQENISAENDLEITKTKKSIWQSFFCFLYGCVVLSLAFSRSKKKKKEKGEKRRTPQIIEPLNTDINYSQKFVKSEIRFSDVAGLKEEKEELIEVVEFLKAPNKYINIGAGIPKGVLLSGAPGTGKTLLAKAVAGEADVPFIATSGPEFDEMYVGVGASRVRKLFEEAKKKSPCIIFIDEIDTVGQKRSNSESRWSSQTINQLLAEMDGFDTKSNIIVLAATNRLDSLDPALVRPGRFDRNITVNLPDVQDREEILKIHAKNKKLMDDVSFETIARNTSGFSGAELENLLNEAAIIAVRKDEIAISKESIEEALKKIRVGLQKKGRKISEHEKRLVAYHEAGHAVISKFMTTRNNVKEVSIIPRGTAGGYTLHETVEDKNYTSKTELEERLLVLLGGRAAEQVALNDISTGASNDLEVATKIAKEMICIYGMNEEIGPVSIIGIEKELSGTETMSDIIKVITKSIKKVEEEVTKILNENRALLDEVANTLLEKESISGDELDEIFELYLNNATIVK